MKRKAFTLIELLIVVAIIAILAAIAVPNFLEAQTRSKVSRQWSNMRTTATALEAYYVDDNHYPICTHNSQAPGTSPTGTPFTADEAWKIWPGFANSAGGLTTPIAYITSDAAMEDIFRLPLNFSDPLANQIMYLPTMYYDPDVFSSNPIASTSVYSAQMRVYGHYVLRSAGPDNYYQNVYPTKADYGQGTGGWNRVSYDPSNGTISGGDLMRSQKETIVIRAVK